MYAFVFDPIT